MARPVQPVPSRRVLATMTAVAVVAIVAAILSFGDGGVSPSSASPPTASPTGTAGSSGDTSASPPTSATPAQSDSTEGVARWTAVSPATPGPDPRSGHTWTVDPSSAVAYLFGGRGTAGPLGDVWAYDMTADRWVALQPSGEGPSPRFEHGAAWIDGLGLVVFGGRTEAGVLDDFWAFDPSANAWRALEISGAGPSARSAACLALRADGQLWMYGGDGADGTASTNLWVYDPGPSSWAERAVGDGPGARAGMACWWSTDDRLVVHGGRTSASSTPVGDLWAYDPDAGADGVWQEVEATDLVPRDRAAATTTSRGGVAAGGIGSEDAPLADVVVFDGQSLAATVLRPAPDGPAARSGAALADDPEGERTLMYGGLGADGPLGDLWALDLP